MNRQDSISEIVIETDPGLVPLAEGVAPSLTPVVVVPEGIIQTIAGLNAPNILLVAAANSLTIAALVDTITFDLAPTANTNIFDATTRYDVAGVKVVGIRKVGWGSPAGTLSRAAYTSYTGQTVSNPPTQAEVQALDDAVKLLSQTVAALLTDLHAATSGVSGHGLIGT